MVAVLKNILFRGRPQHGAAHGSIIGDSFYRHDSVGPRNNHVVTADRDVGSCRAQPLFLARSSLAHHSSMRQASSNRSIAALPVEAHKSRFQPFHRFVVPNVLAITPKKVKTSTIKDIETVFLHDVWSMRKFSSRRLALELEKRQH
jgi:hypothetical protein